MIVNIMEPSAKAAIVALYIAAAVFIALNGVVYDEAAIRQGSHAPAATVEIINDTARITWWGGWDAGFVGDFMVTSDNYTLYVQRPGEVRGYVDVPAADNITVYAEDVTTGRYVKIGGG